MVRIFIENQELDVKDDFSHQITYAIDDLKNLDSKSTSFSKTIVLPGSANNNRLLGNIFEFANSNFNVEGSNVLYNFNAAKSAKARLEVNGLTIIKGILRLLEIIIDDKVIEYEVAIFGELGGLFNKLGTSKLEDLNFSQYNHTYTTTNIKNSWNLNKDFIRNNSGPNTTFSGNYVKVVGYNFENIEIGDTINIYVSFPTSNNGDYIVQNIYYDNISNTTYIYMTTNFPSNFTGILTVTITLKNKRGIGYYYPLIDYGNVSTDKKNYQYKAFRPAIFVKEIITKIIKNAGYSYESNFFKSNFFTRLIIPNNDAKFYRRIVSNLIDCAATTDITADANYNDPSTYHYQATKVIWNTATTLSNFTQDSGKTKFTYTYSSNHIKAQFSFSGILKQISSNYDFVYIHIVKNGTTFDQNGTTDGTILKTISFNHDSNQQSFNVNTEIEFDIVLNDTITAWAYAVRSNQNSQTRPVFITIQDATIFAANEPNVVQEYLINDNVVLSDTIPKNIFQKDFFASILKMFNLMVIEDRDVEKKLIIEPWVDFYDLDRTTYLDWSDKIDRSQVIKIKPMSEINARYYQIKYKSENDYFNELYKKKYNEGYGDINFDNALEFAKDSSTTEVIFSATPLVGYVGESKVVPTIFKWDGKTAGTNEESITSNIRIMQAKEVSGVTSWNILNGATVLASSTTYGYAGHLDNPDAPAADLNFGSVKELYFTLLAGALQNNLFNTYYSSYLAEITDKDSRLVTAKIKLTEKDIYNLDFGRFIFFDGVLYRLQRIVDYSAGDICTVELLRVIYTQY